MTLLTFRDDQNTPDFGRLLLDAGLVTHTRTAAQLVQQEQLHLDFRGCPRLRLSDVCQLALIVKALADGGCRVEVTWPLPETLEQAKRRAFFAKIGLESFWSDTRNFNGSGPPVSFTEPITGAMHSGSREYIPLTLLNQDSFDFDRTQLQEHVDPILSEQVGTRLSEMLRYFGVSNEAQIRELKWQDPDFCTRSYESPVS